MVKERCDWVPGVLAMVCAGIWLVSGGRVLGADPQVTNVRAVQRTGTKLVDIWYDVSGTSTPAYVSLQISSNGGTTFAVPAATLSGDLGTIASLSRNKHIVWNAGTDWNGQLSTTMKFRVTATDVPPAPTGFALIPAGNFQMGDQSNPLVGSPNELPVHTVYVSAFYMGKYEVTNELWDEVRAWGLNNGYTDLPVGNGSYASKGVNHPVHSINWYAMVKWCNARSQKEGLTPCYTVSGAIYKTGSSAPDCNWSANGYRLPTEAEWEKAARGGLSGLNYPNGNNISPSEATFSTVGEFDPSDSPVLSTPVGSLAANGYGLYDMAGNMWEWCWDWYGSYSSVTQSNPRGATSGSSRVYRGGSWCNTAQGCRVAFRYGDGSPYHEWDYKFFGFRLARSSVP